MREKIILLDRIAKALEILAKNKIDKLKNDISEFVTYSKELQENVVSIDVVLNCIDEWCE